MAMVNKKKMETMSSTNGGRGRDLISELPDPILHYILSFLDMTNVLDTIFLSKRWRYLWTTLPYLNFSKVVFDSCSKFSQNENENENEFFMAFVDRVLISRDQNSSVLSFRFSYGPPSNYHIIGPPPSNEDYIIVSRICAWIHILIRSNVQVIDFRINSRYVILDSFKLPISLFTTSCKSLTTLKLDFSSSNDDDDDDDDVQQNDLCPCFELSAAAGVGAESLICIPSLKTLHLKSLLLDNSVELLISKSSVLETLIISYCISSTQEFNICNPQIKRLVIDMFMVPDEARSSYELCDIKVFAPKMTSFSCTDFTYYITRFNRYTFVNVSSLMKAEIDVELLDGGYRGDEIVIDPLNKKNAIDCLRDICNVRSLTLSAWLLELIVTDQFPEHLESLQINPFRNLTYLQLKTFFSKHQIDAITYLLEKCPNLERLVLKVTNHRLHKSFAQWIEDEGSEAELAPQCIMHHLRHVEIWDVIVGVNQYEFLKFLLKNAVVLEKMIVFTSKKQLDDDKSKRFRECIEKLKSFRKASTSSEILFV